MGSRLSLHLLREKAVENLKMLFPTSLTKHGTPKNIQISLEKKERHRRMYAIEAINAAREFDVPSILPLAYYAAAQLSFSDIVKGVPREDGTRVQLQIADVLRVIQGREDLILSRRHTVFRFLSKFTDTGKPVPPSAHCPNVPMHTGETCFYALMRMNLDFNSSGYMESTASALDVMSEESREMIEMFLCESCWKMFRDAMYIGRGKNWKALPRYFGLGRWEAVVEAQEMADRHWKSDD